MPQISSPACLGLAAVAFFACVDDAAALGLGGLRTRSFLGERFFAEVEVLTTGKEFVDAGCFRLRAPQGDSDLPWLKRGSFALRRGSPMVLEIHSEQVLRDPVVQVGILVACGHEVQRDYTLLLSPRGSDPVPAVPETAQPDGPAPARRRAAVPAPSAAEAEPAAPKAPVRRAEGRSKPSRADRLVLSGGGFSAGEGGLRLATELSNWKETTATTREAQREILRLEYRMLAALAEQATSQLAAAEKLRTMEETLAALRTRTDDLAGRMEKGTPAADKPATVATLPAPAAAPAVTQPREGTPLLSEWSFYGALLGAALGIGGWLGWQQFRQRRSSRPEPAYAGIEPPAVPFGDGPSEPLAEVDLDVGSGEGMESRRVDMPLEYLERPDTDITVVEGEGSPGAAEPEEPGDGHEANPVMELAEIMLSFGRVKGAAQALQEYIDNNPQEALQPWIRLMDVYRMAGMREDFERLARDLNRHFNVEVQQWERSSNETSHQGFDLVLVSEGEDLPNPAESPRKALAIEDVAHISQKLVDIWETAECREYLDRLLRDNRGGQRSGFTLPVVEEILFLMELHETRDSLDKQTMDGEKK